MDRRRFISSSVLGTASLAMAASGTSVLTSSASAEKKVVVPSTELRLSFQEGTAPGESLNEKLDYMENLGIVGFDPGGGNLAARVSEFQQALFGRNIKVSAI